MRRLPHDGELFGDHLRAFPLRPELNFHKIDPAGQVRKVQRDVLRRGPSQNQNSARRLKSERDLPDQKARKIENPNPPASPFASIRKKPEGCTPIPRGVWIKVKPMHPEGGF